MEAATSKLKISGIYEVADDSNLMELVENQDIFDPFVDHKFQELDRDKDGKLSVKELQPAVADIGAALGLPAQGSSPDSDRIYSEVLNEFTHGGQEKMTRTEFKKVLSDLLFGMAAGLKRDPIVILRIDGEDLSEFINGLSYESEMVLIFSHIEEPNASLHDYIIKALDKLSVDQGMPPSSDSWVMSNVIEPTLHDCDTRDWKDVVSQENFLVGMKRVCLQLAQRLRENPVIVAHSENLFDGSSIRRLLSNKFELDKSLNTALESVPKDHHGKISKQYLRIVLDDLAPSAGLPPLGAVDEVIISLCLKTPLPSRILSSEIDSLQLDKVIANSIKMIEAEDGKMVKEDKFKKLMAGILGSVMLQLEGNPISVSSNSVVHEPLASSSSSTFLQPSS